MDWFIIGSGYIMNNQGWAVVWIVKRLNFGERKYNHLI